MSHSSSPGLQCERLEEREVPATIVALNGAGRLLTFDSNNPSVVLAAVSITGLAAAGEKITDIDVRPGNGLLYGRSNFDRLYIINPISGSTTPVGGVASTTSLNVGMDFDPTADSLRVVGNSGENLAINPNTGSVASFGQRLSYQPGDIAQGQAPRVTALAFTNSLPLALTTTLYGIDHVRNSLVRFTGSPNSGQIATVGSLGFDITALTGLDIQPGVNVGFATVRVPGSTSSLFCVINLQTGAASILGPVGNFRLISDIAIASGSSFLIGSVFVPPTSTTIPTNPLAPPLTQPLAPGLVSPLFPTTFSSSTFTLNQPSTSFNTFRSFSLF